MSDPNLVTTCNFNNRDYFVKMHVTSNNLELVITDKLSGEDWQCSYDSSYIETITQKTGNFKQFSVFIAMLKSGLLKTSNSVYLDLMTFDDLDALRNHRIRGPYSMYHSGTSSNNRRYLILTYTVEFDRIHYPLPLEYCGPPDPKILQQNIIKLEEEIANLKSQLKGKDNRQDSRLIVTLQKKVDDLTEENLELRNETLKLTNMLERKSNYQNYMIMLQNAIQNLEKSVLSERKSHHKLVEKLRKDKIILTQELDRIRNSERELLNKIQNKQSTRKYTNKKYTRASDPGGDKSRSPSPRVIKSESWHTHLEEVPKRLTHSPRARRRPRSTSDSESNKNIPKSSNKISRQPSAANNQIKVTSRPVSSSSRSSSDSRRSRTTTNDLNSPRTPQESRNPTPRKVASRVSELDFTNLEKRILALQKMLQKGFHIT